MCRPRYVGPRIRGHQSVPTPIRGPLESVHPRISRSQISDPQCMGGLIRGSPSQWIPRSRIRRPRSVHPRIRVPPSEGIPGLRTRSPRSACTGIRGCQSRAPRPVVSRMNGFASQIRRAKFAGPRACGPHCVGRPSWSPDLNSVVRDTSAPQSAGPPVSESRDTNFVA